MEYGTAVEFDEQIGDALLGGDRSNGSGCRDHRRFVIPRGSGCRLPVMTIPRSFPIKSGVKAGFNPQPDPPKIANLVSQINVIRVR